MKVQSEKNLVLGDAIADCLNLYSDYSGFLQGLQEIDKFLDVAFCNDMTHFATQAGARICIIMEAVTDLRDPDQLKEVYSI